MWYQCTQDRSSGVYRAIRRTCSVRLAVLGLVFAQVVVLLGLFGMPVPRLDHVSTAPSAPPSHQPAPRPSAGVVDSVLESAADSPSPRPAAPCVNASRLPRIHVPLSVTSRNLRLQPRRIEELPLLQFALPSLIATAEPHAFRYGVTLGVDRGDPWYDNATRVAAIQQWWAAQWRRRWPLLEVCEEAAATARLPPLEVVAYDNTESRNTWAVNFVTQRAYEAGYDYFYRINDDTRLVTARWSSIFVAELRGFRPLSGVGVTGPGDRRHANALLTHSFVGRAHLDIFGAHFPFTFGNYYSDDWIQNVYAAPFDDVPVNGTARLAGARFMSIVAQARVDHIALKPRYTVKATHAVYVDQLRRDREALVIYLLRALDTTAPRP